MSLNSNNQILVHTGLDTAPSTGIFPHSERSLLLHKWTHMAVEVLGHTLRLVLDGRVEVETEVGYALPWRLSKIHLCCDLCYYAYLWFCILIGLVEV